MMDDWELISQYIRLVIEASDLPKWGHYEVIDADNDFKLTDTHEDSDNGDLRNNLKPVNCNYNNDLYVKELKKKWTDFIDAELNKALADTNHWWEKEEFKEYLRHETVGDNE